jgi:hypothetical protein
MEVMEDEEKEEKKKKEDEEKRREIEEVIRKEIEEDDRRRKREKELEEERRREDNGEMLDDDGSNDDEEEETEEEEEEYLEKGGEYVFIGRGGSNDGGYDGNDDSSNGVEYDKNVDVQETEKENNIGDKNYSKRFQHIVEPESNRYDSKPYLNKMNNGAINGSSQSLLYRLQNPYMSKPIGKKKYFSVLYNHINNNNNNQKMNVRKKKRKKKNGRLARLWKEMEKEKMMRLAEMNNNNSDNKNKSNLIEVGEKIEVMSGRLIKIGALIADGDSSWRKISRHYNGDDDDDNNNNDGNNSNKVSKNMMRGNGKKETGKLIKNNNRNMWMKGSEYDDDDDYDGIMYLQKKIMKGNVINRYIPLLMFLYNLFLFD